MERLRDKTVLIVDDSEINRVTTRELLQGDLNVLLASGISAAIELFSTGKRKIDIVLTNIVFSDGSGFDLLNYMGEHHLLETTPVIIISSDLNDTFIERAFRMGAIDFVHRPFAPSLLVRRVITTILLYQSKRELAGQIAKRNTDAVVPEKDPMTGLYTKAVFCERAYHYLYRKKDASFCMMAIDINHFRLFNQIYGRDAGDKYIIFIAELLKDFVEEYGGVAGYAGGDDFYYLVPDIQEIFSRIMDDVQEHLRTQSLEIGYAPKFGVYRIIDEDRTVIDMCDCADSALEHVKKEYSRLLAWYDSSMNSGDDEFKLLQDVEFGLRNHEFTFYLQPKVNLNTGKIIGAEALARWIRQDNKMIGPTKYIPVLERNGFIFRLDKIIWEQVCKFQRFCMDMEYPVLPISVNISRADIYAMDVASYLVELLKKYDLPKSCLELEITESAYIEESGELEAEIDKFKDYGFTVIMDDFGSGYSSLNSLKDMDIDVLKIDMRFLDIDYSNAYKGVSILDLILQMAESLNLAVIVEGVEFPEQVNFLTTLGCDYVQGFYYYKPMRKEAYEDLLNDHDNLESGGAYLSHKIRRQSDGD